MNKETGVIESSVKVLPSSRSRAMPAESVRTDTLHHSPGNRLSLVAAIER